MADAEMTDRRLFIDQLCQGCDPPGALTGLNVVSVNNRDPG
jgi:hypothetical protein